MTHQLTNECTNEKIRAAGDKICKTSLITNQIKDGPEITKNQNMTFSAAKFPRDGMILVTKFLW